MAEVAGTLCTAITASRRQKGEPLYLVLKRPDGSWDLPKGLVRHNEPVRQAAVRETEEETNIIPFLTGKVGSGDDGEHKIWIFRAEFPGRENIGLSKEHVAYDWVTAKKAVSILYPPLAKIVREMTGLTESLSVRSPLLEGEDPHAHLKADPKFKPPSGPSDRYYDYDALHKAHRENYFAGEKKLASSREKPAKHLDIPLGSWRIDSGFKGIHGHEIDELQAHKPRDIAPHPGEMTWEKGLREHGRKPDVERYANWLEKEHDEREARGEKTDVARIPPLGVTKHEKGHLRISDGHRRLSAVDLVNQRRAAKGKHPLRVPAWTSWTARHPEGLKDSEGREMKVGLTHQIAQKGEEIDRSHSPVKEDTEITELRDSCLDCVRKHLSQALVLMQEVKQGYPHHRWIAVGHMGEAADECCKEHPELADEIRKHRLKYMKDPNYVVPIMDLIAKADKLVSEAFMPDWKDPRRCWKHVGGDLEASYDGAHYVDFRDFDGNRTMFASRGLLRNALKLFKSPIAEESPESCGSVAVSLLKPGTKRYEKWLAQRTRRRRATMRKKQQEDDMTFSVTNLRTGEVTTSEDMARREEKRRTFLAEAARKREIRESSEQILFWSEEHRPENYENCILSVPTERVERVLEALQSGEIVEQYKGWANCRICEAQLGTCDLAGRGYLWPDKAEHYVVEHGVWTPALDRLYEAILAEEVEDENETISEEREVNPDGTTSCGVFIPLPFSLAKDFPDKKAHDDSPPHFTVLYMGNMSPKSYKAFVGVVRRFAETLKPFECDLQSYSEFLNKEGQKIPHMRPSAACATKLAIIHAKLRRFVTAAGIPVEHSYGHVGPASSMVPYEIQFKAHATLGYLPPMMPYMGPKPTGCWRVTELECWGHEQVRIPLGKTKADQPIGLRRDPLAIKYPMSVPDAVAEEEIPGGRAQWRKPSEFDPKELAIGIEVEKEHLEKGGYSPAEMKRKAQEIAMDHLAEFPDYYTRLKKMEKEGDAAKKKREGALKREKLKIQDECVTSLKGTETHHSPTGGGPSQGDIGLDGSLPVLEIKKKLERKKLAGLAK